MSSQPNLKPPLTFDVTTRDGKTHTGFYGVSMWDARHRFLCIDPGYSDEDIVAGGVRLREIAPGQFYGKRMRAA